MVYPLYRVIPLRLSICANHLTNKRDRPLRLNSQATPLSYSFKYENIFSKTSSFFFFSFLLKLYFTDNFQANIGQFREC